MKGNLLVLPILKGSEWCDKDEVMLIACFQLLENYIQEELSSTNPMIQIDWTSSPSNEEVKKEIDYLYKWWKERPKREFSYEDADKNEEEDQEHLERLIKIRQYLWT